MKLFNEIAKYNPYHDAGGRFATQDGSHSFSPGKGTKLQPKPGTTIHYSGGGKGTAIDPDEPTPKKPKQQKPKAWTTDDYNKIEKETDQSKISDGAKEWEAKATKDEVRALAEYTAGTYSDMNDYLRGKGKPDPDAIKHADTLKTALQRAELKHDIMVYRGSGTDAIEKTLGMSIADIKKNPDAVKGLTFQDKGFVSTSPDKTLAEEYADGVVYKMALPKGTKAIHTTTVMGADMFDGDEVTVAPDTKFTIDHAAFDKQGTMIVYMRANK